MIAAQSAISVLLNILLPYSLIVSICCFGATLLCSILVHCRLRPRGLNGTCMWPGCPGDRQNLSFAEREIGMSDFEPVASCPPARAARVGGIVARLEMLDNDLASRRQTYAGVTVKAFGRSPR
jgi:hypothetical protein